MRGKSLNEVFNKTHELTGYSPEVIASALEHVFREWVKFMEAPSHAGMFISHLGTIRSTVPAMDNYLKNLLGKSIRANPEDNSLKEKYKVYWQYRRLLQQDVKRKKYKERFGKWHYKSSSSSETES